MMSTKSLGPNAKTSTIRNINASFNDDDKIQFLDCPQAAELIRAAYKNNFSGSLEAHRKDIGVNHDAGRVLFVVTTDASCQPRPSPHSTFYDGDTNATSTRFVSNSTKTQTDGKHSGVAVVIRRIGGVRNDSDNGEASHRYTGQQTRKNSDRRTATIQSAKGRTWANAIDVDADDSDSTDEECDNRYNGSYEHPPHNSRSKCGDKIKIVLASTFLGSSNAAETFAWNVAIETLLRDREACTMLKQGNATILMLSDNTSTIEFYTNHCDLQTCRHHFVPSSIASRWKKNLETLIRLTKSNSSTPFSIRSASAEAFGSSSAARSMSTLSKSSSMVIGVAKVRGLRDGSFAPMGFFDHSAADLLSAIARYEQPKFNQWRPNAPKLSDVDILWLEHSTNKSLPSLSSNGKRNLSVQEMIRSEWGIDLVPLLHDGYSKKIHPIRAVKTPTMVSKRRKTVKHKQKALCRISTLVDPPRDDYSFVGASLPPVRTSSGKNHDRNVNRKKPPPSLTNSQNSAREAYLGASASDKGGMTHDLIDFFAWLHATAWEHGDDHGEILFYNIDGQWKTVDKSGDLLVGPYELNEEFPALLEEQGSGQFDSMYTDSETKNVRAVRSLKPPQRNTYPASSVTSQSNSLSSTEKICNKRKKTMTTNISTSALPSASLSTNGTEKLREKKTGNKTVELLDGDQEIRERRDKAEELSIIDLCDDSSDEESDTLL